MAALEDDLHHVLRAHKMRYDQGDPRLFSPEANIHDIHEGLRRMGRPAEEERIRDTLDSMMGKGSVWPGAEWDTWSLSGR